MKPPHPSLHTPQPHRLEPCHHHHHRRQQQRQHLQRRNHRQGKTFLMLVSFPPPPPLPLVIVFPPAFVSLISPFPLSPGLRVLLAPCAFEKAHLTLAAVRAYQEKRLPLPSPLPLSREEVDSRLPAMPGKDEEREREGEGKRERA